MGKRKSVYSVRLTGIGDGQHTYDFELDQSFFDGFDHPDLNGGKVQAQVLFDKKGSVRKLFFSLSGTVSVRCDRCLEYFDYEVEIKEYLILKAGDTLEDIDEHLVTVPDDLYELDLEQYLFEFIVLSLPLQRVHPGTQGKAACDPEMLNKLRKLKPKHTVRTAEENDPRWNALKNLLDND